MKRARTGIEVSESDSGLCISWDNRTAATETFVGCFLLVWLSVWIPATLFATAALLAAHGAAFWFCLVWLIFFWGLTIGAVATLLMRRSRERLEVDATAVTWSRFGLPFSRTRVFPLASIKEISVGRLSSGGDRESVTLNIMHSMPRTLSHRAMIAWWLVPELKQQIFDTVETFVTKHDLPIRLTRVD